MHYMHKCEAENYKSDFVVLYRQQQAYPCWKIKILSTNQSDFRKKLIF